MRLLPTSLVLVGLLAAPARAAPPDKPEDALAQSVARIRGALESNASQEALGGLVRERFDFDELARRSLGDAWKSQSKADRERFVGLLRAVIEANYLPKMRGAPADFVFEVKTSDVKDGIATVRTVASARQTRLPLDFRLRRVRERWMVFDTVIDGVGLVDTYEEQFTRLVAKSGMAGLLRALEAKRAAQESPPP